MQDLQGLTIIKKDIQIEKYKDCFIILNRKDNWKDTLEHELTHFVQKTVGFNKTEQQIKQSNKFNNFIYLINF